MPVAKWLSYNNGEEYLSGNPSKDLMDVLIDRTRIVGHMLTAKEARLDVRMFKPHLYAEYFASFENAALTAWDKVQSEEDGSPRFLPQLATRAVLVNGHLGDSSDEQKTTRKEVLTISHQYTYDEAKSMLLNFYGQYGRFPKQAEARPDNNLPSYPVLTSHFGFKKEWKKLLKTDESEFGSASIEDSSGDAQNSVDSFETPELAVKVTAEPAENASPEEIEIETSCAESNDSIVIDLKIAVPGRENPICITLTI